MSWFRNLKIGSKLLSVVGVLMAMMVFLAVFATSQLGRVNAVATEIETSWLPSVTSLAKIQNQANATRRQEMRHLLSTTDDEMCTT
jgi:methyl-accepting chemotaxis protein